MAQTYTYMGYAEGYGSELATGDTLACKVDGFNKYLTLDVRSTYYRPGGSNGSENKQDTLHSVYFAVPNEIIREYGVMTAVHTAIKRKIQQRYARGNRQAGSRRCRARAVPLFRISVGFGLRGVCLSAARSAALVSRQAHAP